jgi:peptidyl-Lys metalloendopeptidase
MKRIQSLGLTAAFTLLAGCAGSDEGAVSASTDAVTLQAQTAYFEGCLTATSTDGFIDRDSDCAARARGLTSQLDVVQDALSRDGALTVHWTVRNNGTKTAYLPRWQAPRAELENDLFQVNLAGAPVPYLGKVVKRAAARPTDLVAIAPGRSITATVELSKFYDTSAAGEYVVQHQGETLAAFGASNDAVSTLLSNPVSATRSEASPTLAAAAAPTFAPDAAGLTTRNCSASQQSAISSALSQAGTYANNAKAYLTAGTKGARYTTWFGTYTSSRYSTALSHYTAIASAISTKTITVDCGCSDDSYAYVYPNQPYIIYVCNAFQSAPIKGTDSKGGTLIHELSHFNVVASTDDRAYGQTACKALAKSNPANALDNADSHEYFAENNPAQN